MAIGASLVLPCVAPVCPGADDSRGRVSHCRFHRCRLRKVSAKVAFSQKTQRYLRRIEVIHAGLQAREIAGHNVEFDLVECSGAGCGTKVDFSAGVSALLGNSRREIKDAGEQTERPLPFATPRAGAAYSLFLDRF